MPRFFSACAVSLFFLFSVPVALMAQSAPPKITVLVIYRPGPGWLEGKSMSEQPLKEHGRYMLSLYEKGLLKSAGPFTDNSGGAVILEVPDVSTAQRIVSEDPAVKTGVFAHELHPWGLVSWEKLKK